MATARPRRGWHAPHRTVGDNGRVGNSMPQSVEDRVEHALSQLIEQLLPALPEEDEAAADEKYYDALNYATESIGRHGSHMLSVNLR